MANNKYFNKLHAHAKSDELFDHFVGLALKVLSFSQYKN